jgi:inositol transport system ATP-binding protein
MDTPVKFVSYTLIPPQMNCPDHASCILEMQGISKSFPGVTALDSVSLSVCRGEIHALMGENGAGKSTLMKILAGVHQKDTGVIELNGRKTEIKNESHALKLGIAMVHQELNNFPDMTIAENIFAGREPSRWGILSRKLMNRMASDILADFHLDMDPGMQMGKLSISGMQRVEIARAISCRADILILDEPTSAIALRDAEILFGILQRLKKRGVSIIYISHKMDEVFRICDRVTVLRDGKLISTDPAEALNADALIARMVGRELKELFPVRNVTPGETILEVRNLSRNKAFSDISFKLRRGEVLGLAGLVGSGRTEILESLFGIFPANRGSVYVRGIQVRADSPVNVIEQGIALVPEDRKVAGLVLQSSVLFNISLAALKRYRGKAGIIRRKSEITGVNDMAAQLQIRFSKLDQSVDKLSGGNQQKVVMAKWLLAAPSVLLLDEPTRGIDIGSKSEIYLLINKLVEEGISILLVSSEMTELMGMCDRIMTIRKGKISREFSRDEFNQEKILSFIMP